MTLLGFQFQLESTSLSFDQKYNLANQQLQIGTTATSSAIQKWAINTLIRSANNSTHNHLLLNNNLWKLVLATTINHNNTTSQNTLQVWAATVTLHSQLEPSQRDNQLINTLIQLQPALLIHSIKKSSTEKIQDALQSLWKATLAILESDNQISHEWDTLATKWIQQSHKVLQLTNKGGKKISSHTIQSLPTIVNLINRLGGQDSTPTLLRGAMEHYLAQSIFSLDNLQRGMARDTYNSTTPNTSTSNSNMNLGDSSALELVHALNPFLLASSSSSSSQTAILPSLTTLYISSLSTYSSQLFPLPHSLRPVSSSTSASGGAGGGNSAYKSASELYSLQRRREWAWNWVRNLLGEERDGLGWLNSSGKGKGKGKGMGKWQGRATRQVRLTLQVCEKSDLVKGDKWESLVRELMEKVVDHLEQVGEEKEEEVDLLDLSTTLLRINFDACESFVPKILHHLSIVTSLSSSSLTLTSAAAQSLLTTILTHHSRSQTIPTLIRQLFVALSSPSSSSVSVVEGGQGMRTPLLEWEFQEKLKFEIAGLVSGQVAEVFDELGLTVRPGVEKVGMEIDDAEKEGDGEKEKENEDGEKERKKKRRKLSPVAPSVATTTTTQSSLVLLTTPAQLSLLSLILAAVPSPILLSPTFKPTLSNLLVKAKEKSWWNVWSEIKARWNVERTGFLEEEEELGLSKDERKKLVKKLGKLEGGGDGKTVVELIRTLLLSLTRTTPPDEGSPIFEAVLRQLNVEGNGESWSGILSSGMTAVETKIAVWEMVSRRWLTLFESLASKEQIEQIAKIVLATLGEAGEGKEREFSMIGSTMRLIRRADFFELGRLRTAFLQTRLLRDSVSLPHLISPSTLLTTLASKSKPPKELRRLSLAVFLDTSTKLSLVAHHFPREYLGRPLRADLVERALGLDIWAGEEGVEGFGREEREELRYKLRRCVKVLLGKDGLVVADLPAVFAHVLMGVSGGHSELVSLTLEVYRQVIQTSIALYATSNNDSSTLEALLRSLGDEPLAKLSKRVKKGTATLECSERAFFELCDLLSSELGPFKSLPDSLKKAVETAAKSASKTFGKTLSAALELASSTDSVWSFADLLQACRQFWQFKDWIADGENDQVDSFNQFSEQTLAAIASTVSTSPDSIITHSDRAKVLLGILDLLGFRISRLRALSQPEKLSTAPFETFLACHLAFRKGLQGSDVATAIIDNLRKVTANSTPREYAAGLSAITATLEAVFTSSVESTLLLPALDIVSVLLRDAPKTAGSGSGALGASSLSDILRGLCLYVSRQRSLQPLGGSAVAESWLAVAKFLQGICGDRPSIVSRINVSLIFTVVTRLLEPDGPLPTTLSSDLPYSPCSTMVASELWLTLVTVVEYLVRHCKDRVTHLFPQLVATLGLMLTSLRRAGFGTTGSTALEDGDGTVFVGRRAEREARATFPFWVWDGGLRAIGKAEAKAVGRLLASLTAKTAVTLKRKHEDSQTAEKESSKTESLVAPLSKHAPFILLPYLHACVNVTSPIPSVLRTEMQGGLFEVMDSMSKWEKEALMKGFLGEDEEAERGVLRTMWRTWEKERYRGV
ncbi:hypothetical protein T439DRAFT_356570 [Meredithblackwellia eburnea MCA 4105]